MWPTLIFSVFLTAMVTYLVVDSVLLDKPRDWLTARSKRTYVITCPWCFSAWVAAACVGTSDLPLRSWGMVWWAGAFAYFLISALAARVDP
jgi:hypothetical protein